MDMALHNCLLPRNYMRFHYRRDNVSSSTLFALLTTMGCEVDVPLVLHRFLVRNKPFLERDIISRPLKVKYIHYCCFNSRYLPFKYTHTHTHNDVIYYTPSTNLKIRCDV